MYLTKKDKQIQTQQRIIDRLEEENECLKEQLELCSPKHVNDTLLLAAQSREEYTRLIDELLHLKEEYMALIRSMKRDKELLKRECRQGLSQIRR